MEGVLYRGWALFRGNKVYVRDHTVCQHKDLIMADNWFI